MMSRLISTEESSHAKRRNKRSCWISALLVALFTLAGVLTLSPAKAFAEVSDIQIWHSSTSDYDFHCYMSYQNNVPASGNLYNGTTPMYNLYEMPFSIVISRTNIDGSSPSTNDYHYLFGWGFKKITLEFNVNVGGVDVYPVVNSDYASVYIESSSYDSTNKKLTLDCFFSFDNFPVNRLEEVANFTLGCRRNTSALNDTLSIVSVSTSDWQGNISKSNKPLYGSLVEYIVQGINNSSDIDNVISILNLIKQNTDLYSSVLAQLQSIGTDVAAIKQYLISGNAATTVESAAAQQSAALSDYLDAENALFNDAPAGPPQAQALGSTLDNFTESIQHSIYFWSNELYYFFDRLGLIWILLIVGLIIGLTGFLLRLRK